MGQTGKERRGEGGPLGGWASVVLKERQEVVVTIARQVRRVQVREELIRIGEFWKELEKKYRSQRRCQLKGQVRDPGHPNLLDAFRLPPRVLAHTGKPTGVPRRL